MSSGLATADWLFSGSWASQALNAGRNSSRKRRWYRSASCVLPSVETSSHRLKFRRSCSRSCEPLTAARFARLRAGARFRVVPRLDAAPARRLVTTPCDPERRDRHQERGDDLEDTLAARVTASLGFGQLVGRVDMDVLRHRRTLRALGACSEPTRLRGRGFGRGELLGDDLEPAVPERGIGEIEAHDRAELLG